MTGVNGKLDPEMFRAIGSFVADTVKSEVAREKPGARRIEVAGQVITIPAPEAPDLAPIMLSIENARDNSKADTAALVERFEKAIGVIVARMTEANADLIKKLADAHAEQAAALVVAVNKLLDKKPPERKKRKIKHTDVNGKVETFEER